MVDLSDVNSLSVPIIGRFRAAPRTMRDIAFVWRTETGGQVWGIDEAHGGMTTYATLLTHHPDFMINSGDTDYSDGPLQAEVELKEGILWKNGLVEEKRQKSLERFSYPAESTTTTCSKIACERSSLHGEIGE